MNEWVCRDVPFVAWRADFEPGVLSRPDAVVELIRAVTAAGDLNAIARLEAVALPPWSFCDDGPLAESTMRVARAGGELSLFALAVGAGVYPNGRRDILKSRVALWTAGSIVEEDVADLGTVRARVRPAKETDSYYRMVPPVG